MSKLLTSKMINGNMIVKNRSTRMNFSKNFDHLFNVLHIVSVVSGGFSNPLEA
jgi:hypothetical protein